MDQGSLLDRLHAKRAQAMAEEKVLDLPVPGWSGMVWVRYKPVDWEALVDLLERSQGEDDPQEALRINMEGLGDSCAALLVSENGDIPTSLADVLRAQGEEVHGEVRFDQVAVEVLRLEVEDSVTGLKRTPESVADTILALFAGAVSPELAITEHAARLAAWLTGRAAEVDSEALKN